MIQRTINTKDCNQRVDKYVRKVLNEAPLSFIYKIFRKKDVKVNDKRVDIDYILKENDVIKNVTFFKIYVKIIKEALDYEK